MARQIDDIVSFDPAESYEFTNNEIDANCYRRLIRPDVNDASKIDADLAEKWTVSPDGLTFTFKLKRDAKFDSGNPLTANDAAFSLHRVVKLNKTPGFIITQFGFNADNVEKMVRALDDYTLEMKLPRGAGDQFRALLPDGECRQRRGHEDGDGQPDQWRSRQRLAEEPHRRRRAIQADRVGGERPRDHRCQPA